MLDKEKYLTLNYRGHPRAVETLPYPCLIFNYL